MGETRSFKPSSSRKRGWRGAINNAKGPNIPAPHRASATPSQRISSLRFNLRASCARQFPALPFQMADSLKVDRGHRSFDDQRSTATEIRREVWICTRSGFGAVTLDHAAKTLRNIQVCLKIPYVRIGQAAQLAGASIGRQQSSASRRKGN